VLREKGCSMVDKVMVEEYDDQTIEYLVECITREVLLAHEEQRAASAKSGGDAGKPCSHSDGECVSQCSQQVQQLVEAGATRVTGGLGHAPADEAVASMIDHTLLKPDATQDQIAQLCYEARKYNFASVCVNPTHAKLCAQLLKDTPVKVCTVIGFPLGATAPEVKAYETQQAIDDGASEIDMVINVGALKSRDYDLVERDIATVVRTAHASNAIVKVIIEAALLSDREKIVACELAKQAGADYVKTSTGFGPGGATVEDVALMRRVVGPQMGVKAAGGVRTYSDAQRMIAAGATRIGASAGVRIMQEASHVA
jgi:deoxyribose-phosphate aldolase